jgi:agmatinase
MTATDVALGHGPIFMTHPYLIRTAAQGEELTYWNTANGERFTVGRSTGDLLESLRNPFAYSTPTHDGLSLGRLNRLQELGLVVDTESVVQGSPDSVCPTPPAVGLFGSLGMPLTSALNDESVHVLVTGMPYDIGTTGRPGTRFGPQALRGASRTVYRQHVPGDTSGMFDPVRGRKVLRGVGIADLGDVSAADVHDRNGPTMDLLEQIVGATVTAGKFPVVLGGDHSVTLPAVRGVLGAYPRIGILHFDAHPDYRRAREDDWRASCHHGNFMGWLLGDSRVERLVQFGVRQLLDDEILPNGKVTLWPGVSAATASPDAVLESLPPDLPYYVTIDVDCLDPLIMPSTGTPLPGGFSHPQLVDLIERLCGAREIVGVDIVEYLPDGNNYAGHIAADVLLRVLDSALGSDFNC